MRGPRHARRVAVARLRMQAQVLADCKVGAAHSLAALASAFACTASTDTSASVSARTSASSSSCLVRWVGAAEVAAVAADAIAADGCIFLKGVTTLDQTTLKVQIRLAIEGRENDDARPVGDMTV